MQVQAFLDLIRTWTYSRCAGKKVSSSNQARALTPGPWAVPDTAGVSSSSPNRSRRERAPRLNLRLYVRIRKHRDVGHPSWR